MNHIPPSPAGIWSFSGVGVLLWGLYILLYMAIYGYIYIYIYIYSNIAINQKQDIVPIQTQGVVLIPKQGVGYSKQDAATNQKQYIIPI